MQYLLHDWTPATGMTLEEWAEDLWAHGWRDWCGHGQWVTINGESRFRVSLRREPHLMKAELHERRRAAVEP